MCACVIHVCVNMYTVVCWYMYVYVKDRKRGGGGEKGSRYIRSSIQTDMYVMSNHLGVIHSDEFTL